MWPHHPKRSYWQTERPLQIFLNTTCKIQPYNQDHLRSGPALILKCSFSILHALKRHASWIWGSPFHEQLVGQISLVLSEKFQHLSWSPGARRCTRSFRSLPLCICAAPSASNFIINIRTCEMCWWFSVVFTAKLSLQFVDIFRLPIPFQRGFSLSKCKSDIFHYYNRLAPEKEIRLPPELWADKPCIRFFWHII